MLRLALSRSAIVLRTARTHTVRPLAFRPVTHPAFTRYNSSTSAAPPRPSHVRDWDAPKLTYEQVKARSEQPSPDAYLIDVREPDEVIQGSIPSAVNLPLSTLNESFHLNPVAFKEKFGFEKPKSDQEVVFYCRSGKRSATASDLAKKKGFTNIYNYEGSWLDWTAKQQGSK